MRGDVAPAFLYLGLHRYLPGRKGGGQSEDEWDGDADGEVSSKERVARSVQTAGLEDVRTWKHHNKLQEISTYLSIVPPDLPEGVEHIEGEGGEPTAAGDVGELEAQGQQLA